MSNHRDSLKRNQRYVKVSSKSAADNKIHYQQMASVNATSKIPSQVKASAIKQDIKADLPLMQSNNVLDLDDKHGVAGVTRLKDRIYIICQGSNSILVYEDKEPFSRMDEIKIPEMNWPWDIAACESSNCLFVTDFLYAYIWKVNPSNGGSVVKWLSGIGHPYTLSVTPDGRVVMVRQATPSCLEVYGPDATLLHSFQLPLDIDSPNHAVEKPNGNYVISHGGEDVQMVCEMSAIDGQVLASFPDDGSKQLDRPYHVATDKDGRVFVADYYNNRVVVLNAELKFDQVMLSQEKDGINGPQRLCYDQKKKQLLVGHYKGVDICTLR